MRHCNNDEIVTIMKSIKFATAFLTALLAAYPAIARDEPAPARAPVFQHLIDCRAITDTGARLACYDREVAALADAEAAKNVVIIDKEQIRGAKRSLFGLTLPSFKLFAGNDNEDVGQIESRITSARDGTDGWIVGLADGSMWRQIDTKPFIREPKPGLDVVVRRASLGSFMMRVGGAPGVRVKRVM
ncbi:MAG: hypothetical protein P0Y59_17175 [Candidatus Sphingomonas phytovorans]|nr:hypothetical protein [Sphingomonas sp.]WEJ98664.1 MAG: hypothetical protein P0Y59_17175 [Sphingomonas sp.]